MIHSKKVLKSVSIKLFFSGLVLFFFGSMQAQNKGDKYNREPIRNTNRVNVAPKANKPATNFDRNTNQNINRAGTVNRTRPANQQVDRQANRPANQQVNRQVDRQVNRPSNQQVNRQIDRPVNRNYSNNSNNGNNRVRIDNSQRNVNVNVDRSRDIHVHNMRNTNVRRYDNYRPYQYQPYRYGGRQYRCYNPYRYHPYRPHYWGPRWHPWGYFIATLATTAIIVHVADKAYHYDDGVFYEPGNNGYTVVQAPLGAVINSLPNGYQTVENINHINQNNYYYGGAYYERSGNGYRVVAPAAGDIIENLPEGGEEVRMGDQTYVKFGETYYQPIEVNGRYKYEVVYVE